MKCPSASQNGEGVLIAYAGGRVLGSERRRINEHVGTCKRCAAFVVKQRAIWDLLDIWEPEPVSMRFDQKLHARIDCEAPRTVWSRIACAWSLLVARPALPLASVSLLVVAGFFLERPLQNRNVPAVVSPAPEPFSARDAKQIKDAFDDLQMLYQLDVVQGEAATASKHM